MTKDEALKLALEALQNPWKAGPDGVADAIIAIKEALAQPEQERFLVATIGNWGRVEWADGVFPSLGDKMYSAPSTWVGLTDEEIDQGLLRSDYAFKTAEAWRAGVVFAMTKLKEKNCG